ncbi:restriction endonuclease subunit S [Rhizobium leguminosarum bv. viciae]|uniref:restriction endonuclease subunit S n=1 Tax=Rhizobium leguminosarum TaxID=384 RepID=UPI00103B213A|nr:restriction endonuclease subunit S [Rhizobium leguminosarum]TBZ35719.1 restriction endonuclease subunit S [Rhizobium leguminosarum bv. viciae]
MSDAIFNRVELGEIAEGTSNSFVDGPFGSSLKSEEYTEDGVRLIQLQNIGTNQWNDANQKFISERKFRSLDRHGAIPGDIAIAKMAEPVARACIVPDVSAQFVVVADCIRLRPDTSRFVPSFIVKAINSPYTRLEAEKKAIGSTRVRINLSTLKTVGCLVPPYDHQSKIATILDTLDEAIRRTEAAVAKLKAMKQGLLHDLLTRGIDANGNLRSPYTEAPHLYKETPLGWLPKGWQTGKLPGLARSDRPVLRTGPFGSSLKGEHWREVGRPVITIGSFGENGFLKHELLFIEERKAISMVDYEVHDGDIVFSRVADVGRSLVVHAEQAGWIMSSNLMRISIDPSRLLPSLVHAQLRHSSRLRKRMSQLVNSAGRDVANSAILLALDFAVPQPSEQSQIIEAISAIELTLRCEEEQLDKLRLQKSGLMDDLLTGRVSVTPLL